jgi:uncharacterized protein (TIGR02588 family)
MASRNKSRKQNADATGKPALEWAASSLGLLILIALVAILSWDALQRSSTLPAVVIEKGRIMESSHGYTVEYIARNATGATAADVQVEGVLGRDGEVVETARSRIDYVPGSSVRRGGLFFTRNPREHELTLRALGYAEP